VILGSYSHYVRPIRFLLPWSPVNETVFEITFRLYVIKEKKRNRIKISNSWVERFLASVFTIHLIDARDRFAVLKIERLFLIVDGNPENYNALATFLVRSISAYFHQYIRVLRTLIV